MTALHYAAYGGNEKVVARLLAACPALVHARNYRHWTALDIAAANGEEKIVAQILTTNATDLESITTGLHHAVLEGHDKVADVLLSARPDLITATDKAAVMTLFCVAERGLEKTFTQLLAACPELIDAVNGFGTTVLHRAAKSGHHNLVTQILNLRPEMSSVVDRDSWNALMYAVVGGHQRTAELLLTIKPDLVFQISNAGNSSLYFAIVRCDPEFVAKLWRMNPQALTHPNAEAQTPFDRAVSLGKTELVELFQWSVSLDEIVAAFTQSQAQPGYQERYRPVMESQCELLLEHLNQDVMGAVFEYLGFDPIQRASKRAKTHS